MKANLYTIFPPGVTLSEKLNETGVSFKECAKMASIPKETILGIIEGRESITEEIAEALERATHIPSGFWIKKQLIYDEYKKK